jgi:hypothetical protein
MFTFVVVGVVVVDVEASFVIEASVVVAVVVSVVVSVVEVVSS